MFLSVVYLCEGRRQPIQACVFGETKSRSAAKNWSGSGAGYGGGWKEINELDDITGFGWDVVVNNLSGSLRIELIVERDCESILLNPLQPSVAFPYTPPKGFLMFSGEVGRKLCE